MLEKKKLLQLIIASVISSSILGSCASKLEDERKYSDTQNKIQYLFDEDATLSDLYLFPDVNSIFFSQKALDSIHDISKLSTFDNLYTDMMGINTKTVEDAYLKYVDINPLQHSNREFYDVSRDFIDWDLLTDKIYQNGYEKEKENPSLKTLSKGEIQKKLDTMEEFFWNVKQDFPSYDIESLACNLENFSFLEDEKSYGTIAETGDDTIVYHRKLDSSEEKLIDSHEYFHILVNGCCDIKKEDMHSHKSDGLSISTSIKTSFSSVDNGWNSRFHYLFLEEIYAELYAASVTGTSQSHYMDYDEVLSTLQLVLLLQDHYQVDQILENLVYQDPISFIQSFPVYSFQDDYFVSNCKMLKAMDILLNKSKWYLGELEKEGLSEEFKTNGVFSLQKSVVNHLEGMFFNNLIVMNEMYGEDVSLQDNYYIMHLFHEYLFRMNNSLSTCAKREYELTRESQEFFLQDSLLENYQEVMFDYLEDKYQLDKNTLKHEYLNTDVMKDDAPLSFLESPKRDFCLSLYQQKYNYEEPYTIPLQKRKEYHSVVK